MSKTVSYIFQGRNTTTVELTEGDYNDVVHYMQSAFKNN